MKQKIPLLVFLLVSVILSLGAWAQDGEIPEKASRYHEMLRKRPGTGLLFDRFHDAWLDTGSLEGLARFLSKQAEKEDSTAADLLILGFFHARQGNDQLALETLSRALEKDPGNGAAWHEKAKISARSLDFEGAIADLDRALAAAPAPDLALEMAQLKGRLLVRTGKTAEALAWWQKILAENPQDLDFQEDLVELQAGEGLYEEALATSRDLVARTSDPYARLLRQLRSGDICQKAGKRDEALAVYRDCFSRTGGGSWIEKEILSQIERVFRREDDLSGLADFLAALDQAGGPARPAVARLRAELLMELGQPDAAIALFTELLARLPGDLPLRSSFVELLRKAGQPARAVVEMETMVKLHPDDPEWLAVLAGLQHAAGQSDAALASLAAFLEKVGEQESARLRVARLQESFEKTEAAEASYEALLQKFPDSLNAKENFAAFLHRIGKREEAVSMWVILGGSGDRDQALRMARNLISRQEYEAAYQLLESRYEVWKNDPAYLAPFCDTALRLKKFDPSVDAALRWVGLAGQPVDLEAAVKNAALIIAGSSRSASIREELAGRLESLSPQERCLLAELLEKEGDFEKTDRVLAGDSPLLLSQRARILRLRNDWKPAAEATRALLAGAPGGRKPAFLRELAGLYLRAGLPDEARKWIQEWKAAGSGSTEPWLTEAALEAEAGNEAGCLAVLTEASRKFQDDAAIRAALASAHEKAGHNGDARRIYLDLFENSPDLAEKIRWAGRLAQLSQNDGRIDQLIENFQERRRANRQSIVPLLALAEIHRITGDYEERRQALLEASRLKPDDIQLVLEIARIEEAEGDEGAALQTLRRARAIQDSPRIVERTAALLLRRGETEEGFRLLGELGNQASDADAFLQLAGAVAALRDWPRLDQFLAGGADSFPGDYRIHYLRGVAREEMGNPAAAVESFLTVLGIKEERPRKPGTNPPSGASLEEHFQSFPPGYEAYFRYLAAVPQAYDYRHAQGHYGYFGARLPDLALPETLKESRAAALAHLSQIREASGAEARADLDRAVQAAAGADALIMCQLPGDSGRGQPAIPEALLDAHPGNLALHAAWLTSHRRNLPEVKYFERCMSLFEKDHPAQAIQAGIAAAQADAETGRPLLDKAFSLLESIREPGYAEWQVLSSLQEAQQSRSIELTAPQRERLVAKLFELYPAASQASAPYRDWIFHQMASVLAAGEDPRAFVGLLEEKIAEQSPSPGYGSSREQLIAPLPFPPDELQKVPASVLDLAHRAVEIRNSKFELRTSQAEAFFQAAKHPVLKIFFALQARHDPGQVTALVEALSASPEVDPLDAAQIQAAWAARSGKFAEVLAILEKKRFLPMSRELRRRFDAAIVHAAIQLGAEEETVTRSAAGKAAALRMACHPLDASQREELISAMSSLGMDAAVEKEERKAAVTPPALASSHPVPQAEHKIEQWLDAGKRDAAIREAVSQVRSLARGVYSGAGQNWRYQGRNCLRVLEKHHLSGAVLEVFAKDSSKSPAALREYAAAALVLNDEKLALEILRRASQTSTPSLQHSNPPSLFLLAALTARQGETLPADLVASLSPQEIGLAADWIYQDLSGGSALPLEEELKILQSLLPLAGRHDEPSAVGGDWPYNLMRHLTRDLNLPGIDLGPLYQNPAGAGEEFGVPPSGGSNLRDKSRDLRKTEANAKRWALHDQFVAALKDHPYFAELAFECEYAGAISRQTPFDALAEARRVLGVVSSVPARVQGYQQNLHSFDYPGAAELLVADAFRQKSRERIEPLLTGQIRAGKNGPETARLLNNLADLYFCDPSDLQTVFSRRFPDNQFGIQMQRAAEPLFIRVIEAKKLPAEEIESLGLAAARRNLASGSPYPSQLLNQLIAKKLFETAPDRYPAYLGQLLNLYCGDSAARNQADEDDEEIRNFGFLLNELAEKKNLLLPTLDFMVRENFKTDYLPDSLRQSENYRNAARFMSLFSPSSLFAPKVADFNPYEVTRDVSETGSVFDQAVTGARVYGGKNARREIVAALKARPGFGPALLAAAIDEDPQALQAIGRQYFDEIRKLPADRQAVLARTFQRFGVPPLGGSAALARSSEPPKGGTPNLDAPASPFAQWIASASAGNLDGEIQQFLKARTLRDLPQAESGYELGETAIRLMTAREMTAPDEARRIFQQAVKIGRLTMKIDPNAYFDPDFAESLLGEYSDAANPNFNRTRILLDILTEGAPGLAVRHPGYGEYLGISSRLRETIEEDAPLDPARVTESLSSLQQQMGDSKAVRLLLAMELPADLLAGSVQNRAIALQWLKEKASAQPRSLLVETLAMAARLEALKGGASLRQIYSSLAPLESCRPYFEDFLNDESLPPGLRLALAAHLFENYPGQWSPAVILRMARESIASLHDDESYCLPLIFGKIIDEFGSLPRTEEWTSTAAALPAAWKKRTRYQGNPNHPLRYEAERDLLSSVFHVLARLGDESALNAFQTRFGDEIASTGTLVTLVASGNPERALALLNTHRSGLEEAFHANARFSPELNARMGDFLARIEDPGMRFYAEAALSQAPDPLDLRPPEEARKQRIIALAKRFEAAGLEGSLRDAALDWMLRYPETAPFLGNVLAQSFASANLERISHLQDYSQMRQTLRLPFFHVRAQLDAGDAAPAIRAWDGLSERGHSHYGPALLRDLCNQIDFDAPLRDRNSKAATARLEFLRHVLTVSAPEILEQQPALASRFLILSVFSHPPSSAVGLPPARMEICASLLKKTNPVVPFLNLLKQRTELSSPEKAAALRQLNGDPLFQAAFPAHDGFFQSIHEAFPFAFADLEPLLEEMSAEFPRQGWAALDLAMVLAREKQWDKALQKLEKCRQTDAPGSELLQRIPIAAADFLHGAGRAAEARARLKGIQPDTLSQESRVYLESVKGKIEAKSE